MESRNHSIAGAVALGIALVAGGCVPATQVQSDNRELRRMVVETRQELEEVRRDQDRLRALVEYLQYADGAPPAAQSYPAANPRGTDPRWSQGAGSVETGAPSIDVYGGVSADGGVGDMAAVPPGFPGMPGGETALPGAPVGRSVLELCLRRTQPLSKFGG